MARARNIKPGFFKNEDLAELGFSTRLLFIGLWTLADREGRLEDRPKRIKMEIFPGDDVDIVTALGDLIANRFIFRYEVDGERYIQIINFTKHQKPHHMEVASIIPPPPGGANKFNHEPIRCEQRERILERDGRSCVKCKATNDLHIDHIAPISKGGGSDDANLRVLCADCNARKGNRPDVSIEPTCEPKEPSTSRPQSVHDQSTNTEQDDQLASRSTDCLIADSLNPSKSTTSSGKPDPAPKIPSSKPEALAVLAFLNEKTGRSYQPVEANIEFISARLKDGATVGQLRAVIERKCAQWLGDPKMAEYLRPATLFNRTKFAQYQGETGGDVRPERRAVV